MLYGPLVFSAASLKDLRGRWERARRAAAQTLVGPVDAHVDELALVGCAAEVDEAGLHRQLFENSARLGEGFVRVEKRRVPLEVIPEVLEALAPPCLGRGRWEAAGEGAWRLVRPPCTEQCERATCDAWREAIDGLVLGLTGGARHTRTSSVGHGQTQCIDLIYSDAENPLRYGEIEENLVPILESVQKFVRRFRGADVRFLGVSEGVLLYQFDTSGCSGGRTPAQALVEQLLEKKLPHLKVRELSPRPVLDDAAA